MRSLRLAKIRADFPRKAWNTSVRSGVIGSIESSDASSTTAGAVGLVGRRYPLSRSRIPLGSPSSSRRTPSGRPGLSQRFAASGSPSVAESPRRRTGRLLLSASRVIRLRRCAPRSVPRKEWASSMTKNPSLEKSLESSCGWLMHSDSIDSGVIRRTPDGFSSSRLRAAFPTSPCHLWTGISASSQSLSRRRNWSLMRALSGPA